MPIEFRHKFIHYFGIAEKKVMTLLGVFLTKNFYRDEITSTTTVWYWGTPSKIRPTFILIITRPLSPIPLKPR